MEQHLGKDFGFLLLMMAAMQFLTLGFFNHTIQSYMTPLGGGGLLVMFVFPVTMILIALESLAALAFLFLDEQNVMRDAFMKCGIIAAVIWCVFVISALLRGHPMLHAGFFGGYLRQPLNWFAGLQSMVFVVWGLAAFRIESDKQSPS